MNRVDPDKREEFEELTARALDQNLSHSDWLRFEKLLNDYPQLDDEWQHILETSLFIKKADLNPDDARLIKGINSSSLNSTILRIGSIAALFFIIFIPLIYLLNRNLKQETQHAPLKTELVDRKGLCYSESGKVSIGNSLPPAIAVGPGGLCRLQFSYDRNVTAILSGPARVSYQYDDEDVQHLIISLHSGEILIDSSTIKAGSKLSVVASEIQIHSIGTRFYVSAHPYDESDGKIQVDLFEGKIELGADIKDGQQELLNLSAGERWIGSSASGVIRGDKIRIDPLQTSMLQAATIDSIWKTDHHSVFRGRKYEEQPIQKITTTSGEEYTGFIKQKGDSYSIFTTNGYVEIDRSRVKRIDIIMDDSLNKVQ